MTNIRVVDKAGWRPGEWAAATGISRSLVYELLASKRIASVKVGSARIIVTPIVHDEYQGVRVNPNLYTTLDEVDTFAAAMERLKAAEPPARTAG
jgi:selenocysteine lyase/cysteine desulfurase